MAVLCSPFGPRPQFELSSGVPAVGNKLFFYVGGSVNTKQTTYTSSTGLVPNTNPVILDSLGMPTTTELWFTAGQLYKVVYAPSTDTDPPTSPIWTIDNLSGINDVSASFDEWKAGPAPTFVSATSFTLVGDQTQTFTKSRRLKTTNSGGTIYSTITNSVFGVVTTVTVANDSGVLDSGLSAVSYSLISAINPSIDADMVNRKGTAVVSAATTDIWSIAGDFVHVTGTTGITSLGTAPYAGARREIIFDGALTLTHNATTLQLPGAVNIFTAAGDRAIVRADTTANMIVVEYIKTSGLPVVGTSIPRTHISGLTYSNNVADATNDIDIAVGECVDSTNVRLMQLSAITKQSDVAWAVGTGVGGLDTGAVGNSDYYIWVIARVDTGVVDALFSLSSTAPTMPANYTLKRLIGWFKRVGGTIVVFHTFETEGGGLEMNWDTPLADIALTNTLTTTRRTDAVKVPLNFSVVAKVCIHVIDAANPFSAWIGDPNFTDVAPNNTPQTSTVSAAVANKDYIYVDNIRTSAAGLIAARANLATVDIYEVSTYGFRWSRRN